ncbi:MAG: hydroxyisourate hydrolase [Pseudonocardia sp.]|nr:hydroxyisourate hydrolase [Pseudonocardia sp.]MBO0873702.1 hydroxyisourate hydrolase [Pseudonocardia sp.]
MQMITTHVLDSARGLPAVEVPVRLERAASGEVLGSARTDGDGRVRELGPARLDAGGCYRLVFDTGAYFEATGQRGFYPEVAVTFTVADDGHYHVPLLLSPFAYSTYRGS